MPSPAATSCASVIIRAARSREGANWQMSTSVAWVSALIGLNDRFPHALSQISERMSSSTGALNPACCNVSDSAFTRFVTEPSSSPTGNREPSMWRIRPGAVISAAGYAMQPMIRSGAIAPAIVPPGSRESSAVPSNGPPWRWKYHHGIPFCAVSTTVSGPNRAGRSPAMGAIWCALTARTTRSCGPHSVMSLVAAISVARTTEPSRIVTSRPRARIASRWAPLAMRVTSSPDSASVAPSNPPMAPAPTTQIFMLSRPLRCRSRPAGGTSRNHACPDHSRCPINSPRYIEFVNVEHCGEGFQYASPM